VAATSAEETAEASADETDLPLEDASEDQP
jgi:hypothetical protein